MLPVERTCRCVVDRLHRGRTADWRLALPYPLGRRTHGHDLPQLGEGAAVDGQQDTQLASTQTAPRREGVRGRGRTAAGALVERARL